MNHYNIKHRVTISTLEIPIGQNHKVGDIVEHKVKADLLEFFEKNEDGFYTKVLVSREFIIDLYKAIELIEKDNVKKTIRFNPF
jgi:ADP-glucose pyrophosphorylase